MRLAASIKFPGAVMLIAATAVPILGQQEAPPDLVAHNLGGPRVGVTFLRTREWVDVTHPTEQLHMVSQFGWHFERQIVPRGGGPQFVVQWVPLVGGVELGKFLPSFTFAVGVRFPRGFEIGMGPNVTVTDEVRSALVVGGGYSFHYGGVSIPINIAYAITPRSNRLSFLLGYALRQP